MDSWQQTVWFSGKPDRKTEIGRQVRAGLRAHQELLDSATVYELSQLSAAEDDYNEDPWND